MFKNVHCWSKLKEENHFLSKYIHDTTIIKDANLLTNIIKYDVFAKKRFYS